MLKRMLVIVLSIVCFAVNLSANSTIQRQGIPITGGTVTGNLNISNPSGITGDPFSITYNSTKFYQPIILYQKYIGSSMTGTTRTQLATFTLPGGLMGSNGNMEVFAVFDLLDTNGQKNIDCYSGSDSNNTDLFSIATIGTTTTTYDGWGTLINKGSTTANAIRKIWRTTGAGTNLNAFISSGPTINTGTDTTWIVSAMNMAPATGTITLHYLQVLVYPGD